MRHWHLVLLSLIALGVTACEQKKEQPAARQEETPQPLAKMDTSTPPPETDPYATDPMMRSRPAPKSTAGQQPIDTGRAKPLPPAKSTGKSVAAAPAGRTHVVQKGDTLSGLAKKYYGDSSQWKKIWEANKSVVPDPKKLKVGTKLVIP